MPGPRITIDGLWNCLCPSVDAATLAKAINSPFALRARVPPKRPQALRRQFRQLHGTTRRPSASSDGDATHTDDARAPADESRGGRGAVSAAELTKLLRNDGAQVLQRLRAMLPGAPTPAIYEALRAQQGKTNRKEKVGLLVEYLVASRGEKPNAFLYEALIGANWDVMGSAEEVKELMDEMKASGVSASAALYHAALRALAVHPDYLQRNSILRAMKEAWVEIAPEGRCNVVMGLLRDGQLELALDELGQMEEAQVDTPPWLHDLLIYALGQQGHVDEATKLLRRRLQAEDGEHKVSLNLWYFLLDECSRELYYEGTKFVWNRMVGSNVLVPSDGICTNVLATASRYGDSKLATQAIQYLTARGAKVGLHHFEALVDSYSRGNDVENALQVLCIMANGGVQPDRGSTRPVYLALKRTPGLTAVASDALFGLAEKHKRVPVSAFNVVVEGLCEMDEHEKALELYDQVRLLCGSAPDLDTFEPLFGKCRDAQSAEFLALEMTAFGIRPSQDIYDRLICLLALAGDVDMAFHYLRDMMGAAPPRAKGRAADRPPWISRGTAAVLARQAFEARDDRAWGLLEEARGRGMDLDPPPPPGASPSSLAGAGDAGQGQDSGLDRPRPVSAAESPDPAVQPMSG